MFYTTDLLVNRKGGLAIIWLASSLGHKSVVRKLSKRDVVSVNIDEACQLIQEPVEPLALRLSSSLLVGVARIYQRQWVFLGGEVEKTVSVLVKDSSEVQPAQIDMNQSRANLDAITLPQTQLMTFGFDDLALELPELYHGPSSPPSGAYDPRPEGHDLSSNNFSTPVFAEELDMMVSNRPKHVLPRYPWQQDDLFDGGFDLDMPTAIRGRDSSILRHYDDGNPILGIEDGDLAFPLEDDHFSLGAMRPSQRISSINFESHPLFANVNRSYGDPTRRSRISSVPGEILQDPFNDFNPFYDNGSPPRDAPAPVPASQMAATQVQRKKQKIAKLQKQMWSGQIEIDDATLAKIRAEYPVLMLDEARLSEMRDMQTSAKRMLFDHVPSLLTFEDQILTGKGLEKFWASHVASEKPEKSNKSVGLGKRKRLDEAGRLIDLDERGRGRNAAFDDYDMGDLADPLDFVGRARSLSRPVEAGRVRQVSLAEPEFGRRMTSLGSQTLPWNMRFEVEDGQAAGFLYDRRISLARTVAEDERASAVSTPLLLKDGTGRDSLSGRHSIATEDFRLDSRRASKVTAQSSKPPFDLMNQHSAGTDLLEPESERFLEYARRTAIEQSVDQIIFFSDLAPIASSSPALAANAFTHLLLLSTRRFLRVSQDQAFEEIRVQISEG